MRTNFFICLFLLLAVTSAGQNNGSGKDNKQGKSREKLKSPDMSVLNDSKPKPDSKKKASPSDTMNIIPPASYSRFSVGANYGISFYAGDVPADAVYPGFGGYVKYSFSHIMGVRAQFLHGQLSGSPTKKKDYYNSWFSNTVNSYNVQFLFNMGSVDFRQSFPRNNFYFGVGASLQHLKGHRDNPDSAGYTSKINETIFSIPLTLGYKRKVTRNIDIGFEIDYMLGASDNIDLLPATGALPDGNGYFVANIVYNITSKSKPKHIDWSNPVDKIYRDLQNAKEEIESLKLDDDKDGIPNMLDMEPNTKEGYEVDSKGVTLDSDKDGIPNTIDPDPYGFGQAIGQYFPSGFGKDSSGAGGIMQFNDSIPKTEFATISRSGYGLPTIIFPPNHFTVHVEQYILLQQIARILMIDTSASVVIIGHADNNKPNFTQLTLAEKRALEVKRCLYKVYEIDENRMLVFSEKDPYVQKYKMSTEGLNRKVEFRIIRPVQKRMPRVDKEDMRDKNFGGDSDGDKKPSGGGDGSGQQSPR